MAMLGVSGRAPSMRSLTTEKPPVSTTVIVTGLPISIALRCAAATSALASVNPMLMPRSPESSVHRGGGLGVELAVIDQLDHGAVGIGDVAELRIVLRALDHLGVTDPDALEMLEKAIPILDLDGEMRRRHP